MKLLPLAVALCLLLPACKREDPQAAARAAAEQAAAKERAAEAMEKQFEDAVAAQKKNFDALLKSVKFGD